MVILVTTVIPILKRIGGISRLMQMPQAFSSSIKLYNNNNRLQMRRSNLD